MPRYFFHLLAPGERSDDEIGCEFAGSEDAYLDACQAALEISVEMLRKRVDPSRHRFEITDADGQLLFDLPFAEVMRPSNRLGPMTVTQASLYWQQQRTARIVSELKEEFGQTRSLLAETRALLGRAGR